MKLQFIKVSPAENMTVLVLDPLPRRVHLEVARRIMAYGNLHGEQVGFVEQPLTPRGRREAAARLQMMGGEFCGNATRALAACLALRGHPGVRWEGDRGTVKLEVSGLEDVLECVVEKPEENRIHSRAGMPPPEGIEARKLRLSTGEQEVVIVYLPGIVHLLVPAAGLGVTEEAFWELKQAAGLDPEALGVIFYDPEDLSMVPLVYVRETGTLVWERGCGSGALALGAGLAWRQGRGVELSLRQPGGEIGVRVDYREGHFREAWISGPVEIVAEGTVYVNL